jgi:hypothetical protein
MRSASFLSGAGVLARLAGKAGNIYRATGYAGWSPAGGRDARPTEDRSAETHFLNQGQTPC